ISIKLQHEQRDHQSFTTRRSSDLMQDLLRKQGRENKIIEVVRDSNLGKTKIKKLLTRYWQRGMTKNAMLPDYSNSGGKGKTKALTKEKVGRPRRVNLNNEYQTG